MPSKPYKIVESTPMVACEPAVAYQASAPETLTSWSPNAPLSGTQEEWWEYIYHLEQGALYPVTEVHQRISQWLEGQRK